MKNDVHQCHRLILPLRFPCIYYVSWWHYADDEFILYIFCADIIFTTTEFIHLLSGFNFTFLYLEAFMWSFFWKWIYCLVDVPDPQL